MDVDLRVFYPEVPAHAELAPARGVHVGDAAGRCEVFTADGRQVTDRPQGTVGCAITPDGEQVLWFDDDLSGVGVWKVQPYAGGPSSDAFPGVAPGRAAGLAAALDGSIAAAITAAGRTTVYVDGQAVASFTGYRHLVDLSPDGSLLAVGAEPDSAEAVLLLSADGDLVGALDGTAGQVWGMGFAPAGPPTLLAVAERPSSYALLLCTPDGVAEPARCAFDSEIAASWYPDGRRILVRQDRAARSTLHCVDLDTQTVQKVPTPAGTVLDAAVQPDGDVQYVWSSASRPPRLRSASGRALPGPVPPAVPGSCEDLWADGPGGPVHALLSTPAGPGPYPVVFLLHGGPHQAARDSYDPLVSVFVSAGCAVVQPNYRGSTGYGPAWRSAFEAGVGLSQLQDLAAVRAEAVARGIADPTRTAVCGESWGGYLALLAAGAQPELWRSAAAVNPVGDYAEAFRTTTDAVRALDVRLFGGTPDEVPGAYAAASPITYAASVTAPVLVIAATDDPVCPPGQIRAYENAVRRAGGRLTVRWSSTGHEGYAAAERAEQLGELVTFTGLALGGREELAVAR